MCMLLAWSEIALCIFHSLVAFPVEQRVEKGVDENSSWEMISQLLGAEGGR